MHTVEFQGFSHYIFHKKKYVASFSCSKTKIGYHNRFMIIRWSLTKISKIFITIFVLSIKM